MNKTQLTKLPDDIGDYTQNAVRSSQEAEFRNARRLLRQGAFPKIDMGDCAWAIVEDLKEDLASNNYEVRFLPLPKMTAHARILFVKRQ